MTDTIEALCIELTSWQMQNGLPLQCAFEQFTCEYESLTAEQRAYLAEFMARWEAVERRDRCGYDLAVSACDVAGSA